jgi:hypothetical protein
MHTQQKPIGSRFSAASTAEDAIKGVDLSGKIAIVTGGYSGLGLEIARLLVKLAIVQLKQPRTLTAGQADQ